MDARAGRDAGRRPLDSLGPPGKDPEARIESYRCGAQHPDRARRGSRRIVRPRSRPSTEPATPEFLRVARAILGDVDAAHDAVQEGVARALRGRAGYRGTGSLEWVDLAAVVNAARTARAPRPVREPAVERATAPAGGRGRGAAGGRRRPPRAAAAGRLPAPLRRPRLRGHRRGARDRARHRRRHAQRRLLVASHQAGGDRPMTEPEPRIAQLIDAYTPPSPGLPDWDDVVRRAARPAARRPLITGTRILLIAAALAVLLAGSAVAGVGPGRLLLGLVRDDEPAPAPVKHALAHVFHWPHGTHVLLDQSRLVSRQTEVTHWTNDGRPVMQVVENWIAPIRRRRLLLRAALRSRDDGARYSYSCIHGPLRPALRLIHDIAVRMAAQRRALMHWDPWLLDGTAPARTARMVLVHRDGRRTLVPLLPRPVAGLRYFAVRLARRDRRDRPTGPARFVASDANGRRIAAAALTRRNVHPLINTPGGAAAPPGRSGGVRIDPNDVPGQRGTARLSVAINSRRAGRRCLDVDFTSGCGARRGLELQPCTAASSGLDARHRLNLGTHVAFGSVPRAATTVRMILRDGTVVPVPAHDGAYVAVIGTRSSAPGTCPHGSSAATPAGTSWRATSSRVAATSRTTERAGGRPWSPTARRRARARARRGALRRPRSARPARRRREIARLADLAQAGGVEVVAGQDGELAVVLVEEP